MVHVEDEVVPVLIVINKTSAVDIELEDGLEAAVYSLEVFGVTFDFNDFKGLVHRRLLISLDTLIHCKLSGLAVLSRNSFLKTLYFDTRQLEVLLRFSLQVLDKL